MGVRVRGSLPICRSNSGIVVTMAFEIRYALRQLARTPFVTFAAVGTLGTYSMRAY